MCIQTLPGEIMAICYESLIIALNLLSRSVHSDPTRDPNTCVGEGLSVAVDANNKVIGFGYDAAGNVTQIGGGSYSFDFDHHILSAGGVTHTYDASGTRVKSTNGRVY